MQLSLADRIDQHDERLLAIGPMRQDNRGTEKILGDSEEFGKIMFFFTTET